MLNVEFIILDFIQKYFTSPIMDKVMVFITTLGNAGAVWIVAALLLICSKKYRRTGIMMAVGLVISMIVGNLFLKPAVARLRPFHIKKGVKLLISAPHDFSFPSGHTLASFICAEILLLRDRKLGYITLALAILIAFSRLYLYVHYPTDVIAGAVLGILIGIISVKGVNHIIAKNGGDIN